MKMKKMRDLTKYLARVKEKEKERHPEKKNKMTKVMI